MIDRRDDGILEHGHAAGPAKWPMESRLQDWRARHAVSSLPWSGNLATASPQPA
jgi:hypothetical protein